MLHITRFGLASESSASGVLVCVYRQIGPGISLHRSAILFVRGISNCCISALNLCCPLSSPLTDQL